MVLVVGGLYAQIATLAYIVIVVTQYIHITQYVKTNSSKALKSKCEYNKAVRKYCFLFFYTIKPIYRKA